MNNNYKHIHNCLFTKKMTKTWCVGGRHYSKTIDQNTYEKVNPKTQKVVKIIKKNL